MVCQNSITHSYASDKKSHLHLDICKYYIISIYVNADFKPYSLQCFVRPIQPPI